MSVAEDIKTVRWWKSTVLNLVCRMVALGTTWAILGALIGVNCPAVLRGDRLGLLCSVISWAIVMAFTGALLAPFGGRPKGAVLGAGIGLAIAASVCLASGIVNQTLLNIGILIGAIVAATLYPWIRMYVYLITQLWRLAQVSSEA